MRKSILVALAAIWILAVIPALAQEAEPLGFDEKGWERVGSWEGTGTGYCYPYEGLIIYPLQTWTADLMKHTVIDYYVIRGKWTDELGNYGEFGCGFYPQPNGSLIAENTGFWSWYDYTTDTKPVAGQFPKFAIYLQNEDGHTDGTWSPSYTHWPPDEIGEFEGHRIW